VFEAGMAMALNRDRTVLVEIGNVRPMSDTAGVNVIRFDGSISMRRALGKPLSTIGMSVDMDTDDWRDAGSFALTV
jgi:predicted nucleotide-binding protein